MQDTPAQAEQTPTSQIKSVIAKTAGRVASVDVYRGFVMLLMMAEVLSLQDVSSRLPESSFWQMLAFNQSHVSWTWWSLHDMIQPSFSFLVGVALPYSMSKRSSAHDLQPYAESRFWLHTIKRSLILIILGIFLRSMHSKQTNFTFEDTLTQIGLGYTFLVILATRSRKLQVAALAVILIGYWLAFALYPVPGPGFNYALSGVPANWDYNLNGFASHWNKNTNLAWAFDNWFLNLFPREKEFLFNRGGYTTLSFIPTLGTMILGLLAGNIMRSSRLQLGKLKLFVQVGVGLIALGIILHFTGINPIIKRIWTPAWTLFSAGICFLFLAFFFWIIDIAGHKKWAFFLTVIGMNSIAAYCIADAGLKDLIHESLYIHLGRDFDQAFGAYASLLSGGLVLLVEWLILYWMYTKKLFIKI